MFKSKRTSSTFKINLCRKFLFLPTIPYYKNKPVKEKLLLQLTKPYFLSPTETKIITTSILLETYNDFFIKYFYYYLSYKLKTKNKIIKKHVSKNKSKKKRYTMLEATFKFKVAQSSIKIENIRAEIKIEHINNIQNFLINKVCLVCLNSNLAKIKKNKIKNFVLKYS